jgi:hypothetical protein
MVFFLLIYIVGVDYRLLVKIVCVQLLLPLIKIDLSFSAYHRLFIATLIEEAVGIVMKTIPSPLG